MFMRDSASGDGHEPQGIEPHSESEIRRGPHGYPLYSPFIDDRTAMRVTGDSGATGVGSPADSRLG